MIHYTIHDSVEITATRQDEFVRVVLTKNGNDEVFLYIPIERVHEVIFKLQATQDTIESTRLHRHCVVTDTDLTEEELRLARLRRNGTEVRP